MRSLCSAMTWLIRPKAETSATPAPLSPSAYNPLVLEFDILNPTLDLSLAVLVPVSPNIGRQFVNSTAYLVQRAATPFRHCRLVFDSRGTPPPSDRCHP